MLFNHIKKKKVGRFSDVQGFKGLLPKTGGEGSVRFQSRPGKKREWMALREFYGT